MVGEVREKVVKRRTLILQQTTSVVGKRREEHERVVVGLTLSAYGRSEVGPYAWASFVPSDEGVVKTCNSSPKAREFRDGGYLSRYAADVWKTPFPQQGMLSVPMLRAAPRCGR